MIDDNKAVYHEVDFLLPAQKFNIQFSFVSQRGLPFIREFMLRLVHVSPLTRREIATFFGLSRLEVEEAIEDLIDRGELTLDQTGKLTLTEKSKGYFNDIGESPRLSEVYDTGTSLTYELASFNCIGKGAVSDTWKNGIPLDVDSELSSKSEHLAEKYFQLHFHELLDKGFLPKSLERNGSEKPSIYTVNSVSKLKQTPYRLSSQFKIDLEGVAVERDDYEQLKDSGVVHELITQVLTKSSKASNITEIVAAMETLGDEETYSAFNAHSVDLKAFDIKRKTEENSLSSRLSLLGPLYSTLNWELLQKHLAPVLKERMKAKKDFGSSELIWVAPSDPYWGKSERFQAAVSNLVSSAATKNKKIYTPRIYVPVSGVDDRRTMAHWGRELKDYTSYTNGLVEGLLGGSVEILLLDNELAVVIYHVSHPDFLPVTLPIGFLSKDKVVVEKVKGVALDYIGGVKGFDSPNDCGPISKMGKQ